MEIKKAPIIRTINQFKIPCTQVEPTSENAEFINNIIKECKEKNYNKIVRTKAGSFSYFNTILPAYDMRATRSIFELTVADISGLYRIQFRTVNKAEEDESPLYGYQAYTIFKKKCLDYGIDLTDYYIENGKEVKESIEKYIIELSPMCIENEVYSNAHHIDFHSSFPSGLVNTHSEFRPVIEEFYKGRKIHKEYKYVLNSTIGYMQSLGCFNAKLANLSKDAINDNNKRIRELEKQLVDSGRIPLSFNTDGIWYMGDIYHGEGEGNDICEWHNDHTNCTIRFKSKGAYEFIENGNYTPVVRGRTKYEETCPRSEWKWGDIYRNDCEAIIYTIEDDFIVLKGE